MVLFIVLTVIKLYPFQQPATGANRAASATDGRKAKPSAGTVNEHEQLRERVTIPPGRSSGFVRLIWNLIISGVQSSMPLMHRIVIGLLSTWQLSTALQTPAKLGFLCRCLAQCFRRNQVNAVAPGLRTAGAHHCRSSLHLCRTLTPKIRFGNRPNSSRISSALFQMTGLWVFQSLIHAPELLLSSWTVLSWPCCRSSSVTYAKNRWTWFRPLGRSVKAVAGSPVGERPLPGRHQAAVPARGRTVKLSL